MFFRYRHYSLNQLLLSPQEIDKFKERVLRFDTIFKGTSKTKKSKVIIEAIPLNFNLPHIKKKRGSLIPLNHKNSKKDFLTTNNNEKSKKMLPPIDSTNKNPSKPKTFLILGGYPDLKQALIQRGWVPYTKKRGYISLQ